jgi:hypothetical protein
MRSSGLPDFPTLKHFKIGEKTMKMRTLFIINAVVQLIFGAGFLLAPAIMFGVFGTQTDTTGLAIAHIAGGVILSLATISWLGRDVEGAGQDAIAWGSVFLAHFLAGIFTILAILNGTFNALAWSGELIDIFFVVAFFWVRANKAR